MTRATAAVVACLVCASPALAQSTAAPVLTFHVAGPPSAAIDALRAATARCWHDDYDSRVHGYYREVAQFPASPVSGGTVRLEWQKIADEKPVGLLKRVADIRVEAEGTRTRVTVMTYGPYTRIAPDVEAWFNGRKRCFTGRYPSP